MKHIFVEGLQGAGKSTLVNQISRLNPALHVCREGDYTKIHLERSIIKELWGEKAVILPSKEYDMNQIMPILGISTGSSYTG